MPQEELPEEERPLCSINTRVKVGVIFCNYSPRDVRPVWVDFRGQRQDYRIIPAGMGQPMETYLRHLWLFRDASTEDCLVVNQKEWFLLFTSEEQQQPVRVKITLPVYSLKERCLQVVRRLVKPEDYRKLEIARSLHADLEKRPNFEDDLKRLARENGDEIRAETPN